MSRRDTTHCRSGSLRRTGVPSEPQLLMMMLDLRVISTVAIILLVTKLTMASSLVARTGISPRWQLTVRRQLSPVDTKEADVSTMSRVSWPAASRGLDIF